jgi:GT2 family glycosyltransferase
VQRIILVDDGSPEETQAYTHSICLQDPSIFYCINTDENHRGYTYAIETGIEYSAHIDNIVSSVIVLLNSDTIVTKDWLVNLHTGLLRSGPKAMIAGPLSNAATYQSVPDIRSGGMWSTNPLPAGLNIDILSTKIQESSHLLQVSEFPTRVLNGFCFMFKRELLNHIGHFDIANFPKGYGEEVDFSVRAYLAGFKSVVVPSSFVFHKFTGSF